MSANLDPLIRDLIEWVAKEPRTVAEVLEAWRTSCPRLTIWEDALERGFLTRTWTEGAGACVQVTPAGHQFMAGNDKPENAAAAISP